MKIVVTGANGLLGWHASCRIHAECCAAHFHKRPEPIELVSLGHAEFADPAQLSAAVDGAAGVIHFAGVNRGNDAAVEAANPEIARQLVVAFKATGSKPHIVYANSTHTANDTPYGRSKRLAGEILAEFTNGFTNLILPHIFGECAKPFYNNVTATLVKQIVDGESPTVNPDGKVQLLHAGAAAQVAIDAIVSQTTGDLAPDGRAMPVSELLIKLQKFHADYQANIYPNLTDPFDVALFNTLRAATYPEGWPRQLKLNTDNRGTLFEAAKGGGGGQTFMSTTNPGITRGDHFHLNKVERFLVVQGQAVIRIRKVLSSEVWEYPVSGETPAPIDMPTLHTHSIENVGGGPLLTLFWTHDQFDPANPDTFADKVLA